MFPMKTLLLKMITWLFVQFHHFLDKEEISICIASVASMMCYWRKAEQQQTWSADLSVGETTGRQEQRDTLSLNMASKIKFRGLHRSFYSVNKLWNSAPRRSLITPSTEIPYKTSAEVIQALSLNVIGNIRFMK